MRALLLSLAASSLALSAALALAQDNAATNPFAGDAEAVAAGAAIYGTTCAGCHGAAGAGGSGPSLNGALPRAAEDATFLHIIRHGLADTKMPGFPALSDENTWRIIAYVRSLASGPQAPTLLVVAADAKAGEALFLGQARCAACHEVNGWGSDIASDLSAAGLKTPIQLRSALAHEPLVLRFVTVVTAQGARLSGFVRAEDLFTLHLKQRDGTLTMLEKSTLRSISDAASPIALQPLDARQTDDIIAFLSARKGRSLAETVKLSPGPVLPYPRIAAPEARNWTTHRGTLDGGNFSALSNIGAGNVAQLQARWSAPLGDGSGNATPLAVDGVLYASGATGNVYAFDAQNGLKLWQFERRPVLDNPGPVSGNRGVAVLDGRVFAGTADNKLIALNANSGRQLWEAQTGSTLSGYAMSGAPLALRTRIVTGVTGAGAKARGWLDAYDPATGKQMWRFESMPNSSAAGAMTGTVGAYEAQNVTLYWSTTRASGDGGDGDSILAINANTGAVIWRHKLRPGAGGDSVVLADQTAGTRRALLLHLGRDGVLTVLERGSGKPVLTQSLSKERIAAASLSFDRSSFVLYAGMGDAVAAVDIRTGRVLWRAVTGGQVSGVLATRGGVVFATLADGQIIALASDGGKPLWRFRAGGPIGAAPVSYAVGGRQFIAVTAGNMLYAFALPG